MGAARIIRRNKKKRIDKAEKGFIKYLAKKWKQTYLGSGRECFNCDEKKNRLFSAKIEFENFDPMDCTDICSGCLKDLELDALKVAYGDDDKELALHELYERKTRGNKAARVDVDKQEVQESEV